MTGSVTTTCLFVDAVFFVTRVDFSAGAFRRVGLLPVAAVLSLGVLFGSLFFGVGFFLPTSFFFATGLFFAASFLFGAAFFFGPVLRLGAAFFLATAIFAASGPLSWRDDRFFVFLALTELVTLARPDSRRLVFLLAACPFDWRRAAIRLGFEVRLFFVPAFFSLARRGFGVPDRLPDLRMDFAI